MSRARYPKIGGTRDMRKKWGSNPSKRKCLVCGALAEYITEVEVNWFRGDDECVNTCAAHRNDMHAITEAWIKQQAEKLP
jgi:hypothetical protein